MKTNNVIVDKSFNFSLEIISLYKILIERKEFIISKQLLRSVTSIGANVEEAVAAQSRKDFIHKMSIASKEARETKYWIRLLEQSKLVETDYSSALINIDHILNILTKIVKTTSESTAVKTEL